MSHSLLQSKPFLVELLADTLRPEALTLQELFSCIETCIYFDLCIWKLTRELLWKIGDNERVFDQWFQGDEKRPNMWTLKKGLPGRLEKELNIALV